MRRLPSTVVRRLTAAALVGAAALLVAACDTGAPDLEFTGPDDGVVLAADAVAEAAWEVRSPETVPETVGFALDGEPTEAEATDGALRWTAADLDDGEYVLSVQRDDPEDDAEPETLHEWRFALDTTAPEIELTSPDSAVVAGDPVVVAGTTEPGAVVTVDAQDTTAGDDGGFEVELADPPEGEIAIVAVDAAGNASDDAFTLVTVPSRVEVERIRGVHVTAYAWATPSYRERVLAMIDDGIINTVALTLKDEGGMVGWDSEVDLAQASGAASGVYDLAAVVEELHAHGAHVAGRIVAFRDGMLGGLALERGESDWLIQTPDGEPFTGKYGCCFISFASPDVIEYNLALAEEAAAVGVDTILWDYIRRPDGPVENMVVPGVAADADGATLEAAVADFARQADERLARYGVGHAASLYGIAADRPTQIAQDVPALSEHLDFVAPMVYPSHWGPGEYGVADPNRQPYDIITATLGIWKETVDGARARIVPWLEDTRYREWDRPHQVREQIRAARDQGIEEFLMWDPNVQYTLEAYDTIPEGREE
ncbi:MAG TPA: putative glycoside hydrolase [Egicoccus sp.]|nr:putative glycoside hydrolase [Egicoccus sp.]HSK24704.1 putative glycoside hydrolase [Egicoccus sp.]